MHLHLFCFLKFNIELLYSIKSKMCFLISTVCQYNNYWYLPNVCDAMLVLSKILLFLHVDVKYSKDINMVIHLYR